MLLRLLCAVMMIGAFAGPAKAATLYSDNFDDNSNESSMVTILQSRYACSYSGAFGNGYAQDVDSSQKFNGTFSIKQSYTGSQYDNPPQGGGSCEYDFAPTVGQQSSSVRRLNSARLSPGNASHVCTSVHVCAMLHQWFWPGDAS